MNEPIEYIVAAYPKTEEWNTTVPVSGKMTRKEAEAFKIEYLKQWGHAYNADVRVSYAFER